jgi:proteic killer suppression protein
VIETFADKATAQVFSGTFSRKLPGDIQARANVKLITIHHATELQQLLHPLGNNLEALSGNLAGFHSIRINRQWRIIFRWENDNAHDVKITDYH